MAASDLTTDKQERLVFGALILGGNVLAMVGLTFIPVPAENATIVGQLVGGFVTIAGMVAQTTWKTGLTERQQATAIQTLAAANAAPVTTTTTTTVEKGDK